MIKYDRGGYKCCFSVIGVEGMFDSIHGIAMMFGTNITGLSTYFAFLREDKLIYVSADSLCFRGSEDNLKGNYNSGRIPLSLNLGDYLLTTIPTNPSSPEIRLYKVPVEDMGLSDNHTDRVNLLQETLLEKIGILMATMEFTGREPPRRQINMSLKLCDIEFIKRAAQSGFFYTPTPTKIGDRNGLEYVVRSLNFSKANLSPHGDQEVNWEEVERVWNSS